MSRLLCWGRGVGSNTSSGWSCISVAVVECTKNGIIPVFPGKDWLQACIKIGSVSKVVTQDNFFHP